jgi:hypothetical protein
VKEWASGFLRNFSKFLPDYIASQVEKENYLTSVRDFGLKFTVNGGHFYVEVSIYKNYRNKIAYVQYVTLASDGGKNEPLGGGQINKLQKKQTNTQ